MPFVTFLPSQRVIEVEAGTTLFDAARQAGLPVASSCQADFVCGKCHMKIVSGGAELSQKTSEEDRLLRREKNSDPTFRVSCQAKVQGDCTVTTSYW